MGQKMTTNRHKLPKGEEVNRNRFEFQNIIGKGGFGKVWKVTDKKQKIEYALKEMAKVKVIDKKSERAIKYERELLSHLRNPFIVNMYYAFQDYDNLYLVMDLLTGGDLRYHICRHRKFSEEQTRFLIACIVLGLEYIHSKNVIHRDIKPENLVLDDKGYVRITDFGIAKVFSNNNSSETSGTPGYMSPEVMKNQNHTMAVDYFALGVMGYEFMLGYRPYIGKSRSEIKDQMINKQAQIHLNEIPDDWSKESADFINKLLQRKPECRLGFKGAKELKDHLWLKNYPWDELNKKTLIAPFQPEKRDNFDKRYCNSTDKLGLDTQSRYEEYHLSQKYDKIFENFTYYPILDTINNSNNSQDNKENKLKNRQNNLFNHPLHNSKSKPNMSYPSKKSYIKMTGTSLKGSPSGTIDQLNSFRKNSSTSNTTGSKLSKQKTTSQSTHNFRNFAVKKSVNLNNMDYFSCSNMILSSNNQTITPSYKNKPTDKATIDQEPLNKINLKKSELMKKRSNSKSACSKHIKQSLLIEKEKTKNTLQRSSSSYGYISGNKPVTQSSYITVKVIESAKNKKQVPHSTKLSGQFRTPSNQISQSSIQINNPNFLFKNYKASSTSCNSTGSSYVSNNNKKPK